MSSEKEYHFDPNYFMKLANIEEFGEEEHGFTRRTSELSFEVNEEELIKELEALSPSLSAQNPNPAYKPANFAMIRTGPEDINDFNVENMVLTPEDENNPELLAELSALIEPKKVVEPIADNNVGETVEGLKKEVLRLKREGDLEGAKNKLKQLLELEKTSGNEKSAQMNSSSASETARTVIPPTNIVDNAATSTTASLVTSPKLKATDTQIYRDLFAKLQKQSTTCQSVSEFYASVNKKSDSTLFIKRKQALDLELQKLRLMLKSKQPAPQSRSVSVTYEYMLSNPDVPEGQLQVSLGPLKVILPRKFKLKDTEEYRLKIFYELFGLEDKEMTLTSEPFTTAGLSKNVLGPYYFKCSKKDLRVIKSVEYKKMRLEIVGESGFLFFKSSVVKLQGQCKFDRLLKDCTFREDIDLFDVEEGKKSALPSAKLTVVAKLKSPLTSDGFKQLTEKWTVISEFGYSNHTLYSDLSPPVAISSVPNTPTQPQSPMMTGTLADMIKSFEVIEFELGLLAQNQSAVFEDAKLMDLQVALEALRDRIQMQVELGQISLEDYLNSVKMCIGETKQFALEAKRAGDLQLAQKFVKHVDIMRKEVAEAEASMASEE